MRVENFVCNQSSSSAVIQHNCTQEQPVFVLHNRVRLISFLKGNSPFVVVVTIPFLPKFALLLARDFGA
jgi:hypothetical protein